MVGVPLRDLRTVLKVDRLIGRRRSHDPLIQSRVNIRRVHFRRGGIHGLRTVRRTDVFNVSAKRFAPIYVIGNPLKAD